MNFQTIGYNGKNVGTISFQSDKLAWKDNRGHSMEISSSSIKEISWIIVGNKADLNLSANGVHHKFDGFSKSDFENIRSFAKDKWILELRIQEVCLVLLHQFCFCNQIISVLFYLFLLGWNIWGELW